MKKASANRLVDDLRPEYDLSKLKGGVRGKYDQQAVAATKLVSIEQDLAEVFGDAEASTGAGPSPAWRTEQARARLMPPP